MPAATRRPRRLTDAKLEDMLALTGHADSVELFINGASKGKDEQADDGYIYAFPDVAFAPGSIKAVAYKAGQKVASVEELVAKIDQEVPAR